MEFSIPAHVPAHLGPAIELGIRKAQADFPIKTRKRIAAGLFSFAQLVCKAAENGEMTAEHAHASLEQFLHALCVYDPASDSCGHDSGAFDRFAEPIKREIRQSSEWLACLERLAALGKAQGEQSKAHNSWPPSVDGAGQAAILAQRRHSFLNPLLTKRGLTRSGWAAKAGVDPSVVYDYLSGKSSPRPANRNYLAQAIGLQASELPE